VIEIHLDEILELETNRRKVFFVKKKKLIKKEGREKVHSMHMIDFLILKLHSKFFEIFVAIPN